MSLKTKFNKHEKSLMSVKRQIMLSIYEISLRRCTWRKSKQKICTINSNQKKTFLSKASRNSTRNCGIWNKNWYKKTKREL